MTLNEERFVSEVHTDRENEHIDAKLGKNICCSKKVYWR